MLLNQIALAISVFLDRPARRFNGWKKIFDRVPALLADLVTEFESLHLTNAAHADPIFIRTALLGPRRRNDAPGIVVLGRFFRRILDDILGEPM